jgi:hypothetical protein
MQCTVCLQSCSRSAKFIIHHSSTARGLTYGQSESEKDWKSIWKVNAPWKMKIHLWRFAHNCLPSEVQLVRRHIPVDAILSVGVLRKSSFPCISSGKFSFHASSGCSTSLLDHPCSRLDYGVLAYMGGTRQEILNPNQNPARLLAKKLLILIWSGSICLNRVKSKGESTTPVLVWTLDPTTAGHGLIEFGCSHLQSFEMHGCRYEDILSGLTNPADANDASCLTFCGWRWPVFGRRWPCGQVKTRIELE